MSDYEWLDIFGDNLKSILDENKMTQKDLAEVTGLTEAAISRYIKKQRIPTFKAMLNIAYALDCSLDELGDFGDTIE